MSKSSVLDEPPLDLVSRRGRRDPDIFPVWGLHQDHVVNRTLVHDGAGLEVPDRTVRVLNHLSSPGLPCRFTI